MSNLSHRQSKIQEKRKQTPWKEFVMEICSWFPLNLYKNQGIVSRYPNSGREGNLSKLSEPQYENSIERAYDSNSTFFENYYELWLQSKKNGITHFSHNENAEFVDMAYGAKNCYLGFSVGGGCENVFYSACIATNIHDIYNCFIVTDNCSYIYDSKVITGSFNIYYSYNIHNSSNCWFSSNLTGCSECLFCDNIQNQSYCINNKNYDKILYFKKKQELLLEQYNFDIYKQEINKKGTNFQSENCNGNAISFSQNVYYGESVTRFQNSKNIFYGVGSEKGSSDMFDGIDVGIDSCDFYAVVGSGTEGRHYYCTQLSGKGTDLYYCSMMEGCSFCLGCIGLKNKSYCIFNKQYSKEERYIEIDRIFAQMETEGTLGQFFPARMNSFYFNDTAAYLIDPSFSKEEVTAKGYMRRDEPIKVDIPVNAVVVSVHDLGNYEGWRKGEEFISSEESSRNQVEGNSGYLLPDTGYHWHISPEILNVIIQDESGNVYRIVKMEYDFLMKHGLPLPRKHRLDRMKENFKIS